MLILLRLSIWLWVPPLLASFAFWPHLGASYQPEVFWRDIPGPLGIVENVSRIGVIVLSVFMCFGLASRHQKLGWWIYALGLGAYIGCQIAIVVAPASAWATSPAGFLAPAYTPAIWMLAIALTVKDSVFLPFAIVRPMFVLMACVFLAAHVAHASIVYFRL